MSATNAAKVPYESNANALDVVPCSAGLILCRSRHSPCARQVVMFCSGHPIACAPPLCRHCFLLYVLSIVLKGFSKTLVALTAHFHAARDTNQALYKELPSPWVFDDLTPGEVPECHTALTTLPAHGTAKHRLTPQQQADLESKQAQVAAQRQAAAQRMDGQAAQQAKREANIRKQKERERNYAEEAKVECAKDRMRVVEARKQQRAAQEQEALLQQKKAARAAQDAAR